MNPVLRRLLPLLLLAWPLAGEDFLALCARKAAAGEGLVVPGANGWLFLRSELQHLAAGSLLPGLGRARPADQGEPLAAITGYAQALAGVGMELLFVPIPAKATIHPEGLEPGHPGPVERLDPHHLAFYRLLAERGIQVYDPAPDLIAARERGPVYCRTDSHPNPAGLAVVAHGIAERVRGRDWYAATPRRAYRSEPRTINVAGDLGKVAAAPPEELVLNVVSREGGGEVAEDPAGPLLLLSDSHGLIFHEGGDMLARQAGLSDLLALELGFPVHLIGCRGSAATPVRINLYRQAKRDPALLVGKRLVVWCLSVRELTASAWSTAVPVPAAAGVTAPR